jgi:hypothetical protein
MKTAEREIDAIQSHAEAIRNDGAHEVATASPGDTWAQGDVGIVCLAGLPAGCRLDPNPTAQLAPGETQGSRHCLTDLAAVNLYRMGDATPLDGPVIEAPQGCTIAHPEHGDVTLPPGTYGVIYQRAYADELRRVQD